MRTLVILLVAGGIGGLIAWRTAPSLIGSNSRAAAPADTQPAAREGKQEPRSARAEPPLPRPKPPRNEARDPRPAADDHAGIWVSTTPLAAIAMVDGRPAASCETPCVLPASRGTHRVTISHEGYQTEYALVNVAASRTDLPPITLRPSGGVLLLTSSPAGAGISLNGRAAEQATPARLPLAAGTYYVAVEKDGRRASQEVQVQSGIITYVKIPLDQ